MTSLENTTKTLDHGVQWVRFVSQIKKRLDSIGETKLLAEAMQRNPLPTAPDFMVGVAGNALEEGIEFSTFRPKAPDGGANDGALESLAINDPVVARRAFAAFHQHRNLLTDDGWASIGSSVGTALSAENFDGNFTACLDLLADVVSYTVKSKRSDMDVKALLSEAQFFDNLRASIVKDDDVSVGSAVFLALQEYVGKALPPPTRTAANGIKAADVSEEFEWFKGLLEGATPLTDQQNIRVATLAKEAVLVRSFLDASNSKPINVALTPVVKASFLDGALPRADLSLLLDYYDYLRDLLGDEFSPMLERYAIRVTDKNLNDLKLENCPSGLVSDSYPLMAPRWKAFHARIGELLLQVPVGEWLAHLSSGTHLSDVLMEKIETSGLKIVDSDFRRVVADLVLGVLGGRIPVPEAGLDCDRLLDCIDPKFHPDVFRTIRERLSNVDATTLAASVTAFPNIVTNLLTVGDRLAAAEKDNVVRYILCSATRTSGKRQ